MTDDVQPRLPNKAVRSLIINVGFIGLGRMGTAMAGTLLRAGHEVTVYNRTPRRRKRRSTGVRLA